MIVLDAGVVIAVLDADDPFHTRAVDVVLSVAREPLRASAITLAEVLVRPARLGRSSDAERAIQQLGLEAVGIGPDASARLASLRVATGLKLPDCCVLLAAEQVRAHTVLTFDERLARAARAAGYPTEPAG